MERAGPDPARIPGAAFLLVPVLIFALLFANSVAAQNTITPDEYGTRVRGQVSDILKIYYDGGTERAIKAAVALDDEVNQYVDFMAGHPDTWAPDLLLGRLYHEENRDADVLGVVAPVLSALNTDDPRHIPYRAQALMRMGRALVFLERFDAAEPVLRRYMREVTEHSETLGFVPEWTTLVQYFLARTATRLGAPDAGTLRAGMLDGFWDKKGATEFMYLRIWSQDLSIRNAARPRDPDLIADTVALADYIAGSDTATLKRFHAVYGLLARIFSEQGDFARALPLAQARFDYLQDAVPGTQNVFWAWQNLAGLHRNRGDYEKAITIARAALVAMANVPESEAATDRMTGARAALHGVIGVAAYYLENDDLMQRAMQQAYVAYREIYPPNHPSLDNIAKFLKREAIDPAVFPYAEELGIKNEGSFVLSLDASDVIGFFLAGRFDQVGRLLDDISPRDNIPPVVVSLNKAWHHALLGEIDKGLLVIAELRKAARTNPNSVIAANSPAADLVEAVLMNLARDHLRPGSGDALARLARRSDLTATQSALMRAMQVNYLIRTSEFTQARQSFDLSYDAGAALIDATPAGSLLGIALLANALEVRDMARAKSLQTRLKTLFSTAPDRALARLLTDIFVVNNDDAQLHSETGFVELAFQLADLQKMLPREHQWAIASQTTYARALLVRSDQKAAAEVYRAALRDFRRAPEHRADVAGYLNVELAWTQWALGQTELATAIFEEVWDSIDFDVWQGNYWLSAVVAYSFSLQQAGRLEDAGQALDYVMAQEQAIAKLAPLQAMYLHIAQADFSFSNNDMDRAGIAYNRAVDVVPDADSDDGQGRSQALYRRAYYHFYTENRHAAFADMTLSNTLWFDRYEAVAATGTDVARSSESDHQRIVEEANIGWDFAQELKKSP